MIVTGKNKTPASANAGGLAVKKDLDLYMRAALREAGKCLAHGDVPVGAVVVFDGKIIARGHNVREKKNSPLWHAEMVAVERASKKLGRWNLAGATLVVTKEPCAMCAGLVVQSRITKVVFGVGDVKGGCCGGALMVAASPSLNHRANIVGGVLERECLEMLKGFFGSLRRAKKAENVHKLTIYEHFDKISDDED